MHNENSGEHMEYVMSQSKCPTHVAPIGEPCWTIIGGHNSGRDLRALCGRRVRMFFNGVVSSSSSPKKTYKNK